MQGIVASEPEGPARMPGGVGTQRGMITTLTCVFALVLLLVLLAYSTRAGVTDQRISADSLRQKQAFFAAEAGIALAREWFNANRTLINANLEDMLGAGIDGWLVAGSERWVRCGDVDYASDPTHPCWGDPVPDRRDHTYFYYWNGSTELPIGAPDILAGTGTEVKVEALMCLLHLDLGLDPALGSIIEGCHTNPALLDGSKLMVTLLATGGADCAAGTCAAQSSISEQIASFSVSAFAQLPGIPLVTKSELPTGGLTEIVANINGGGAGIPASIWGSANPGCTGHDDIDPRGAPLITCDAEDWYGGLGIPLDLGCGLALCECPLGSALTLTTLLLDRIGADILLDDLFPCDLFQFYFGMARSEADKLRGSIRVINDCSALDSESAGAYWITGASCEIAANTIIGSPEHPVMLISASGETLLHSGSEIYGMLFVTDVENGDARLSTTGDATVFGSVVMDGVFGEHSGTFQVIYNEDIMADVSVAGGLGSLTGSWTDQPWY